MTPLSEKQQKAFEDVLSADDVVEFEAKLEELKNTLPKQVDKKQAVADYLFEQLDAKPTPTPRSRRSYIAMLAEVNTPKAVEKVTDYLDPEIERSDRVQYRAALSLWRMKPTDLLERFSIRIDDGSVNSRVRAMILRLLVQYCSEEPEQQDQYIEKLIEMAKDGSGDNSWAVLRALRNESGSVEPLSPELESRFISEFVAPRLKDESEWRDVRVEAALVLGDVEHEWQEAIQALTNTYNSKPRAALRRVCIESLGRLGSRLGKREVQDAMLSALEDRKPGIQDTAIEALRAVLKPQAAVKAIVEALLNRDDQPKGYVDALRRIDTTYATSSLSENLLHPDPAKQDRASKALTNLGGELALGKLLAQNRQFVDKYTEMLNDADEKIMMRHDQLMGQARFSFLTGMGMHSAVFLIGVGILLYTMVLTLGDKNPDIMVALVRGGGSVGGFIAIMLGMFYRNPVKNIRTSTADLVKINIAFLGFIRQINQIDATFKQFYLNIAGFGLDQMKETVAQIQIAVDQSLERVQTFIDLYSPDTENQARN